MKKWKQALALVLALVMALSLVALPSFAADEDASGSGTAVSVCGPRGHPVHLCLWHGDVPVEISIKNERREPLIFELVKKGRCPFLTKEFSLRPARFHA